MRRRTFFIVGAVLALLAVPSAASAQPPGPMVEIDLVCDAPIGNITAATNPVFLWVPGHVTSDDGLVTHIVTGIEFVGLAPPFVKGQTNNAPGIQTVECTAFGAGPTGGDVIVQGFFVPRRGGPQA